MKTLSEQLADRKQLILGYIEKQQEQVQDEELKNLYPLMLYYSQTL